MPLEPNRSRRVYAIYHSEAHPFLNGHHTQAGLCAAFMLGKATRCGGCAADRDISPCMKLRAL
ncbi:hypothetical protein GGR19_002007 [Croceicoccus naphthovorans]|nr:hypothetical protein [Croceicoccus naphthovorans]